MIPLIGIIQVVILVFAVIVHEVAHGWTANQLGDPTAKLAGRLTLDPTKHLDPVGSFLIPGILLITGAPFLFGWAKPVPFNPYNLKNPRRDEALIAAAGPASNILLALIGSAAFLLVPELADSYYSQGLLGFAAVYFVTINLVLALFNMIPIPPLDGSKILFSILPESLGHIRRNLESFGFLLILAFIFLFPAVVSSVVVKLVALLTGIQL